MKASLKKLIKKKQLNKITISDIAEDCGISRMTFYYHFKDIYDLVEWCIISDARSASEGNILDDTWENELITIFKVANLNKEFYLSLFNSMDRDYAERYILRFTFRIAVRMVEENMDTLGFSEDEKLRLAEYYSSAFMGIVSCRAIGGMKEDPEEIVKYLSYILMYGIPGSKNKKLPFSNENKEIK